jgi:hypothetical protein
MALGGRAFAKDDPIMASADLESILAKLARGVEHAELFHRVAAEAIGGDNVYELIFEFDRQAGEVDIYGRFMRSPPVARMGAIFGDFIHSYRSALDHLVWALSTRFQTMPPPAHPFPRKSPWRDISFPIVLKPQDWKSTLGSRLRLIDPRHHAAFRELQPFHTSPAAPEREALAMLDGLWNIDKHRAINFPKMDVQLVSMSATRLSSGEPIRFEVESFGPQRIDRVALDRKTQLAQLRLIDPWPETPAEVKVDRVIGVDVLLDQGSPGFGQPMTIVHDAVNEATVRAIHKFESELR